MFFGLYDLYRYRRCRGRYSDALLADAGWQPGDASVLDDGEPPLGSVIYLHRRFSLLSWLIMFLSNQPASHVAAYVGDGMLFEVVTTGATERHISRYFDGKSLIRIGDLPGMTEKFRPRMVAAYAGIGRTRYNWAGTIRQGLAYLVGRDNVGHNYVHGQTRLSFNWRVFADVVLILAAVTLLVLPWYVAVAVVAAYSVLFSLNHRRSARAARAIGEGVFDGVTPSEFADIEEIPKPLPVRLAVVEMRYANKIEEFDQDSAEAHRFAAALLCRCAADDEGVTFSVSEIANGIRRRGTSQVPQGIDELVTRMDHDGLAVFLSSVADPEHRHAMLVDVAAEVAAALGDDPLDIATAYATWAANHGHTKAAVILGHFSALRGDLAGAEQRYRTAYATGDPDVAYSAAVFLSDLGHTDEAEAYYREAAAAGHVNAIFNLAYLLAENGRWDEARSYYVRAAYAGHGGAANNLGWQAVENGDLTAAEPWFRRGAKVGHAEATGNLGMLLVKQRRLYEAAEFMRRAAAAGHQASQHNLDVLRGTIDLIESELAGEH